MALRCASLAVMLFGALNARAATYTWCGGGTDNDWDNVTNWIGNVVPPDDGTAAIVFAGTSNLVSRVDDAWSVSSISFSSTAGAFHLYGTDLTIGAGGIVNSNANTQTIDNLITLGSNQTWNAASGNLTMVGDVDNGGHLLTVSGNFNTLLTDILSGTGGLTKTGTGTNILSGPNTFSGVTTISAGVVNLQNSAALGSTNAGTVVASGAALQLQGGISITDESLTLSGTGIATSGALHSLTNNNAWNGPITLGAATTIVCDTNTVTLGTGGLVTSNFLTTFTGGGNITVNGSMGGGTGGLTKSGVGTLTLTASNSYGGVTAVSVGVLNIQNSSALGSSALGTTVSSGAQLQLQGGLVVAGESLSLNGTGIASSGAFRSLGGSNSWSGAITLSGSTTIAADSGALDLEANITNGASTATFTNVGTILFNGTLGSGAGGFVKNGTGLLVLGGTNTYTGSTTINGGTVRCGAAGILTSASATTIGTNGVLDLNSFNQTLLSLAGAGGVTLGSATLTVGGAAATTFSGVMSGTGGLIKVGAATMSMTGVNTYTGGTTINAGAISIATSAGLGNATNALTLNGGTLTTTVTLTSSRAITLGINGGVINAGGTTLTLSGTISGPGFLTKISTKTLALTGTNTYLGGTTNAAGVMTINSDAALGDAAGSLTFSNSATLTTTASFSSARNVFLNAGTATFSAGTGFTNTLNGVISGAGAFTKSGSGVLILNGSNTFTNLLTISAGSLRLGGNERLSDLAPVLISSTTATLDLNAFNETIGSLASSAAGKVLLSNGFLTAGGNNLSRTNSSVISGYGGFTKAGTGTLIFTGANTYTNTTTVAAGTLEIGANERIANTSPLVISNGATFNMAWNGTNYSETVASLAGAGSVILGTGTLTAGNAGTANFSGAISGTGAFTKVGTGTQIFSGTSSYSGATTVSVGILQVNGSSASSAVTIAASATLSGGGAVGSVAVNISSTNAPGVTGSGTLTSGSQTWASGGNYVWEINDALGTKGSASGWDWMNISGSLTINASFGSKFNLKIVSLTPANGAGLVTNFDNTVTYIWTIASASGGISGFDATKFNLITSGFQNSLGAGTFTVSQAGNDLNLIFTTAAQATINGVQSGTLASSGNGTNTATLTTAVNPANAFLIFTTRHNSSVPGGSMIRGRIASSNSVEFVRVTSETSTMNIQWSVAEYSAGVKVQRGEINQTNTIINVPLAPLSSTNQAFVLWSKTPDLAETVFTDSDPVVGELTTVSNLQFRVSSAPSSAPVISWQVVEFTHPASISVQKGSITNMTGTNLLATATMNTAVDPNGTFLLTGYRTSGSGASIGARMLRAQLTGANTIAIDRSISGAPDDIAEIAWQAVQLKDGSLVQSGSANFTNGVAETNVVLATSLNTNRTIALSSVQPAGGQNTGRSLSTRNVLGVGSATLAMTSSSQLTLDRNNTNFQADIGWSAVGLGPSSILAPATGGSAISADTTGGAYTSLTGPSYTEVQSGNAGAGTIILKVPAGFIFDTNATLPTVLVTRVSGSGANALNINGVASGTSVALTTVNTTNLTLTVTSASSGGVLCSLTWQNIRVRPSAGTPLASGNILSGGTASVSGITSNSTSLGFLAEVVGAANKLALQISPSSTAVAGAEFAQQPVIQIQDQFGNLRSADGATVAIVTNNGTGILQGTTNITAVGGVVTFSGLSYQIAATIKLGFAATGLVGTNSGNITVSAAAASQLTIQAQPSATATAGLSFSQQPVVRIEDPFGNLCVSSNSTVVTATLDQGSDALLGTLTATASSGVATFANLNYQIAETITIDFSSGTLDPETSANVVVDPAAASQLTVLTQPSSTATAGVPFAQQPVVHVEDQFGNLCVSSNSTVITATRDAGTGNLLGTVTATASGGVATFANLAHPIATTITIDFTSGSLAGKTSGNVSVNSGAATRLTFSTQPGSATVGSTFGVQPVVVTQDAYGNNSISGLNPSLGVTLALTSGTGLLNGTANLDVGLNAGNGAVTFIGLKIDSAGSKQLTASASGLASAVSATFNVSQGSQTLDFDSFADTFYGVAPFTLSASASSGLPVTFSIVSGPASVSGSTLSIIGAGTVTVRVSQPGTADYTAATPVDRFFDVDPAALIVTADNKTRVFGGADPAFTASYSGFVNSDNSSVVTGNPGFSTTATVASSVAGSPYSIVATNGTLSASNYTFSFVNGQLAITPASTASTVSSSANSSPTGSNVTFTATVSAVSPGSGTPTGTAQFFADGTPLGSAATLAGGVASLSTSSLSHGNHLITAQYAGDGNFLGSTNSLSSNQVINTLPVANLAAYTRSANLVFKIRISDLLTNFTSDADGDARMLLSVGSGTNAAAITTNTTYIFYSPSGSNAHSNTTDHFDYTITDGFTGGTATNRVRINIEDPNVGSQSANMTGLAVVGATIQITFDGIPGYTYRVQRTTASTGTNTVWEALGAATADSLGVGAFVDTSPPARQGFYRTVWP